VYTYFYFYISRTFAAVSLSNYLANTYVKTLCMLQWLYNAVRLQV